MSVLSGTGIARLGADERRTGPGDFLRYRKGGLAHSVVNTGAVPLICPMIGERSQNDV